MDYLPSSVSGMALDHQIADTWKKIYDRSLPTGVWSGLNLIWPKFNLPINAWIYVVSWHTEYMDIDWLEQQAKSIYPKKIINITDWPCDLTTLELDNIECFCFDTLDQQLELLIETFGFQTQIAKPHFKISSLSMRFSQYKKFVTAHLLPYAANNQILLSWHAKIAKSQDLHGHPVGYDYLDRLDFSDLDRPIFFNIQDDAQGEWPLAHGDWRSAAYQDCLFNLTNESWHYSQTVRDGKDWQYPGPYITEKTFKPLVAGRPFVSVGQVGANHRLIDCGLRTDFGIDDSYDSDPGDLTRIGKIFKSIDQILDTDLDELFDRSIDACQHNIDWITSGRLREKIWTNNSLCREVLQQI